MRTTGFRQANTVRPGTVIESVYYTCPEDYSIGQEFETLAEAVAHAIKTAEKKIAEHAERYYPWSDEYPLKPVITVDVRWLLKDRKGATNTVAERYHYESLVDARAHLDRLRKYVTEEV